MAIVGKSKDTWEKTKFDPWEVENALDTICRARKMMKNKTLMRHVRDLAKKRLQEVQDISKNL